MPGRSLDGSNLMRIARASYTLCRAYRAHPKGKVNSVIRATRAMMRAFRGQAS
jgi:hypothetical protein